MVGALWYTSDVMVGLKERGSNGPGQAVLSETVERPLTLTQYYPYCAIDSLIIGINLVRRKGAGKIDESRLIKSGVSFDEKSKLQGALLFLGLIDPNGSLTDKGTLLREGNKRDFPSTLRDIVTQAYGQEPIQIAKESLNAPSDLISYFMEKNGSRHAMAKRSSRVFLELLMMGGVEVQELRKRRLQKPRTKKPEKTASLNIPISHILTMKMIKEMPEDKLTEWFKKRLPPRQPATNPDASPTTIFPVPGKTSSSPR